MELFKSISSATASRDLKEGIDLGELSSEGSRNQTKYHFNK
jgi:Fic family protein